MTFEQLNALEHAEFVQVLSGIFENSSWVAQGVLEQRPFTESFELYAAMLEVVDNSSETQKLALIREHPDLGGRLKMSSASVLEQSSLGLHNLPPELFERFSKANAKYQSKFGFPFIICVRNQSGVQEVLEAFESRLKNGLEREKEAALYEISQIALHRLGDLIES
jgi:OHCU decarboxylase